MLQKFGTSSNRIFSFSDEMPSEEEKAIIHAYKNNDADYQPFISHEELKRELGI